MPEEILPAYDEDVIYRTLMSEDYTECKYSENEVETSGNIPATRLRGSSYLIKNNVLSIVNNNRIFIWTRNENGSSKYIPASMYYSGSSYTRLDTLDYWHQNIYYFDTTIVDNENTFSNTEVTILSENNSDKIYGNYYKERYVAGYVTHEAPHREDEPALIVTEEVYATKKIRLGLYTSDKRFSYDVLSSNWSLSKNNDIKLSYPYYEHRSKSRFFNNKYKYNFNTYKDGCNTVSLNDNNAALRSYLNKFNLSGYIRDDYIAPEFIGSKFYSSAVINFDGDTDSGAIIEQLMNKRPASSDYNIPSYGWDTSHSGDTWTRTIKGIPSNDDILQHAFFELALLSNPGLFLSLHKSIFAWELYDYYNNNTSKFDDSLFVRQNWFPTRFIYTGGDSAYNFTDGNIFGVGKECMLYPPVMVSRIGLTHDNRIFVNYDLPLSYQSRLTLINGKYTYVESNISVSLLADYITDAIDWAKNHNYNPIIDLISSYNWMKNGQHNRNSYSGGIAPLDPSFYCSLDHNGFIDSLKAREDTISCSTFLEYYRAAVAAVWNNWPSYYNQKFGNNMIISKKSKTLINQIYLAVNSAGASGGYGKYGGWGDDVIGCGGNAGSAATFMISEIDPTPTRRVACNIYSTCLGGSALALKNYDNGVYSLAGNRGGDTLVCGKDAAFLIAGGKEYGPYEWGDTRNQFDAIRKVYDDRDNGYCTYITKQDIVYASYPPKGKLSNISSSSIRQVGSVLTICPYPHGSYNCRESNVDTDNLLKYSGKDDRNIYGFFVKRYYNSDSSTNYANPSTYMKNTGYMSNVYYDVYRPGTPPYTTDIDDETSNNFFECSMCYASNSIFADGGMCLRGDAIGDDDLRNSGETLRETYCRVYADGRCGSGGGGLADTSQNNEICRSGNGGSMAFQVFWYAAGDSSDNYDEDK